jgi:signal transduction histidine kinase
VESKISLELNREVFLEMLLSLFCSMEESRLPDGRDSSIRRAAEAMGQRIAEIYRNYWGLDRAFTPKEFATLLVDFERRIGGEMQIVSADEEKVDLKSENCPLAGATDFSTSLCGVTVAIVGVIAAKTFGYGKVVTGVGKDETNRCRLIVYLKKTAEADSRFGIEYFPGEAEPLQLSRKQLEMVERLDRLSCELTASREDYQHLYQQQVVLNEIALKLASSLDTGQILEMIAESACRLLEAPAAAVLVLNGSDQLVVKIACASGRCAPVTDTQWLPVGQTLAGLVMKQDRPLSIKDTHETPGLRFPRPGNTEVRSSASAPIREQDETIGVLEVYFPQPHEFTEQQLDLLESLAASATIALTNASLYQQQEQAIKARDNFILSASHQLRTPLTTVRGLIDLALRREEKGMEPDKGMLLTTKQHLQRLTDMVNDLLDVTKLENGHLAITPESNVDIAALARGVVKQVQDTSPRHRITIDAPDPVIGEWDPERIVQALTILVNNAVKYSPRGGDITVKVRREGSAANISVHDEGIGVPREDLERIFERFATGSNAPSRRFAGLGIGLPITKEIVELHGGQLWVDSEEGVGSTFHITLPLSQEREAPK